MQVCLDLHNQKMGIKFCKPFWPLYGSTTLIKQVLFNANLAWRHIITVQASPGAQAHPILSIGFGTHMVPINLGFGFGLPTPVTVRHGPVYVYQRCVPVYCVGAKLGLYDQMMVELHREDPLHVDATSHVR